MAGNRVYIGDASELTDGDIWPAMTALERSVIIRSGVRADPCVDLNPPRSIVRAIGRPVRSSLVFGSCGARPGSRTTSR
jgi:hypothetical protein